jgi:hypothetical protein
LDALLFLALCKAIDILIAVLRAFSHGTRRTRTVAQNDDLRPISAAISTPHRNTTHVRRGLTLALETLFRAASRFLLRIAVDPMPLEEVMAACRGGLASIVSRGSACLRWLSMLLLCALASTPVWSQSTEQSLFTTQTPVIPNASDGIGYELGMKLQFARSGRITALRYWKAAGDSGTHVGKIWSSSGALLGSATFSGESSSGWQQQALTVPVMVQANTVYVVSVNIATNFPISLGGLASPITNGDLSAPADGSNGVFGSVSSFPTSSFQSSNYFRDVVFVADTVGTPTKLVLTPATGNTQTGASTVYTAKIQDASGNTVTTATTPITFSVSGVSGSFSPATVINPTNGVATASLTPTTPGSATVTVTATGLTSASASLSVADSSNAPQSLFTTQIPALGSASDGVPYELGMKFRLARSGVITAIRYWKSPNDPGTHIGRIWSSTGNLLASVQFTGETASGWQQQALATPLTVQPSTTYVVSVNIGANYPFTGAGLATQIVNGDIRSVADGANGVYGNPFSFPANSFNNSNYFRDIVFVGDVVGPPVGLTISPATAATQTGLAVSYTVAIRDANGNVVTTATNPITFSISGVTGSFNPSSIETPITPVSGVVRSQFTAATAGTGTITVSSQGLNRATASLSVTQGVGAATQIVITPHTGNAQTGAPVTYSAHIEDANGNVVPGATNAVTFSVSGVSGSFSPGPVVNATAGNATTTFAATTAGTATISASAVGLTGDASVLTVTGPTTTSPQTLFSTQTPAQPDVTDGVPYELGMKFQVARSGRITAVRYWKAASDSGTHVGRIWSSTGALLATTTFSAETASGWQQQTLATALPVQANTTYVVSVNVAGNFPFPDGGLATSIVNGDVSSVADGSNGVFGNSGTFPTGSYHNSNYFRDIVFAADEVSTISPVSGDNQVGSANSTLPQPLVVVVRDSSGSPLPNNPVTFAVTAGVGSLAPTSVTTDANGRASTVVTLGASGRTTITAAATGIGSVTLHAIVPNAIYLENQQPGTTAWEITNPVTESAPEIAGYASLTSVNKGGSLPLKISLATPGQYTVTVYRLGYYAGAGGRLMANFGPLSGVSQEPCATSDPATLLIECNWATSLTLSIGSDWTSGLYIANLTHVTSGKQSQIWFVVRDDASHSDLLFQSSFNTFVAYNNYGDFDRRSLYEYNSTDGQRAYKVSFDRPFAAVTSLQNEFNHMLRYEKNMARWLESQGYDVSYISTVDTHANPSQLLNHKAYLSVGHDEYWSLEMRNGVEQARDNNVNLGFFSANTAYWRVRFEPSTSGEPNRVMVCYKDPLANDPIAPTYLWRGPENNRPENALLGIMYVGDNDMSGGFDYVVTNGTNAYYSNTGLSNGSSLNQLVGYEWDAVVNNGFTPPGLVVLSSSATSPTSTAPGLPADANPSISNAVRYTAASGAKVFSTGSIQFAWGLDSDGVVPSRVDPRLQQLTINILSDMGAKPLTPDSQLIAP